VRAGTDSTKTLVWFCNYSTFGACGPSPATITQNLRWPGMYNDPTGYYYGGFRTYYPGDNNGRYIQPDPLGLIGPPTPDSNPFTYAWANTWTYADPSGLYPALLVTFPNGHTLMPLTTVKNPAQATAYNAPVRTQVPIAVPPEIVDPQAMVNQWYFYGRSLPAPQAYAVFGPFWAPHGLHDYKYDSQGRPRPMYDAFGNFEYGATGASAAVPCTVLEAMGDLVILEIKIR
jgi:RHS repeat-associated protein